MTMDTPSAADLPPATKLAVERTRLAHERTLMAWVRTATSLISFGFTIYKFFQYLREGQPTVAAVAQIGPRGFGLIMISIGLAALALATADHVRNMRSLRRAYGGELVPYSRAAATAALIALLGLLGLLSVLFRK